MRINKIKFKGSQIKHNLLARLKDIKGQRLIEGFYYYLNEGEIGKRDQGWLMMAHD